MFIKKLLFKIGMCLILISFFLIFNLYCGKLKTYYHESEIIHRENKKEVYDIPILEIPGINFEKIVSNNIYEIENDKNKISFYNNEKNLNKVNNIIIAGHNIKNVFGPLLNLKLKDKIILKSNYGTYTYEIASINEISVLDDKHLNETLEKQITLITCTNDTQKRLIVIGKRKITLKDEKE
jgi:LPXTG-site transpeptidase (sortase) family protein